MWVRTEAFHVQKHGNAEQEYEDAFFPPGALAVQLSGFRCAVADGASESAFADLWARLLVRGFGRRKMQLEHLRRLWQRAIAKRPKPWYVQNKIARGAHAAFVGLSIHETAARKGRKDEARRSWRAVAVGDSCLFHVRNDELLAAGPMQTSAAFNNSPYLLASKQKQGLRRSEDFVTVLTGAWKPGDAFYLATDALSQFLLAEQEAERPPWAVLRALGAGTFASLVAKLRAGEAIKNDDTTLLRVEVA